VRPCLASIVTLGILISTSAASAANAAVPAGQTNIGPALPADGVRISVHLPLRNSAELDGLIENQSSVGSPLYHHFLTRDQFRARYGALPASIAGAERFLRAGGFTIERASTQLIYAHADAATAERTFGVRLARLRGASGAIRIKATGPFAMPAELAALHAAVGGLQATNTPRPGSHRAARQPGNRYSPQGNYWADDLKQAYDFASYHTLDGHGVSVATLGASDFSGSDLTAYLQNERVGTLKGDLAPPPHVRHLAFAGSLPFNPNSDDSFEADLDTQQVALTAPGASLTGIAVANDDISNFLEGYEYVDESNAFDVVSSSYGGCELFWTAAYEDGIDLNGIREAYHDLFRQGNAQGTTFVEITQDEAGLICPQAAYFNNAPTVPATVYKDIPSVAFWGDDTSVTAVGGGNLLTSYEPGSLRSTYVSENAYSDPLIKMDPYGTGNLIGNARWGGGSGVSVLFAKPSYQRIVDTHADTRAVPDVSFHVGGCPFGELLAPCPSNRSGDIEVFAGGLDGVIGTSASAPDFAALLALEVQSQHSRLGNVDFDLYALGRANDAFPYHFFRQGQPGDNGVVSFARGWKGYNRIYGLGTPLGADFDLTPFSPPAGDPQTSTNP
jgi:subtilase family serine protease